MPEMSATLRFAYGDTEVDVIRAEVQQILAALDAPRVEHEDITEVTEVIDLRVNEPIDVTDAAATGAPGLPELDPQHVAITVDQDGMGSDPLTCLIVVTLVFPFLEGFSTAIGEEAGRAFWKRHIEPRLRRKVSRDVLGPELDAPDTADASTRQSGETRH